MALASCLLHPGISSGQAHRKSDLAAEPADTISPMGIDLFRYRVPDLDKFVEPFETGRVADLELLALTLHLFEESGEERAKYATFGGPYDPERQIMADVVTEMVETAPVDYDWTCHDTTRSYDALFWTIAEVSPGGGWFDAERAVLGHNYLTVKTPLGFQTPRGSQGLPLKVINSFETERTSRFLIRVDISQLISAADPANMVGKSIYKWPGCTEDSPSYERAKAELQAQIEADFISLKAFYADVSATSDAVVVVKD